MSPAQKALAALEAACREEWNKPHSILRGEFIESDIGCQRYGPMTKDIQRHADPELSMTHIRAHLNYASADGRVLRYQRRDGGIITWWPVGLWEKLQQERKAQEGGAP